MKAPLITVIVPVYKAEKYLERCVDSIRNQTYSNLEIILVDDGSPDNSGMICDSLAKLDKRIKVIHQDNGGSSAARNAGLDAMSGDYVGFVDSDDWIEKEMYEILYSRMISEHADISCCGIKICTDEKVLHYFNSDLEQNLTFERQEALQELTYNKRITGSMSDKLYKANVFQCLRLREGILYEDSQIQPYCLHNVDRVTYTSMPLYCYFQSPESNIRGRYSLRHYDLIKIGEERVLFYQKEYPAISEYAQIYHISNCLNVFAFSYGIKEWKEKRKEIKRYLRAFRYRSKNVNIQKRFIWKYNLFLFSPGLYSVVMYTYYNMSKFKNRIQ